MAFKNKKKQKKKHIGAVDRLNDLERAEFLVEEEDYPEAFGFLREATRKYPTDGRFWELFAHVAGVLVNVPAIQQSCGRLTRLQPANPEGWFGLAYAHVLDQKIALAYRGFRTFIERFPADDRVAEAGEMMRLAESDLRENLELFGFPEGDEGVEIACRHEESQLLLNRGDYEEARRKAEEVIRRLPDFVSARNNLSLILFMGGEAEKAAETAREVLARQPDNFHALANLVRFSVFLGKPGEAGELAVRLRKVKSDNPDVWLKKIEALTFAGDDKAVTEIYREAQKHREFPLEAFGQHLAAFAFYRLGKESRARKIWRQIIDENPGDQLAARNLDELDLPANKRDVFALPLGFWLPSRYLDELNRETDKIKNNKNFGDNLARKLADFFERNPNILHVFSIMLERADRQAKEFAIRLMLRSETPEAIAALREFAFGRHGSDEIRYDAAMRLADAGLIPRRVRLWNDGDWCEMSLMTFEITSEAVNDYPMKPKAEQFLRRGLEAMERSNTELAAQYYEKALEAHGADHPSLLFNLLTVRQLKIAPAEYQAGLRRLVEKYPDYTFAALSLAISEIKNGNLDAARALAERFFDKKLWHVSEIKVWFYYSLELALAEKHFDNARQSLEMLARFDPNLDYEYWDERIGSMELLDKLSGGFGKLFGRGKKKK